MSKHKTKEEWIKLFKVYETIFEILKEYFESINFKELKVKDRCHQSFNNKIKEGIPRFIDKYKKWKMLDNMSMV